MELRPADLGDAFATPVVVSRAQGKLDHATAFLFRLFYRKRAGLAAQSVDQILHQVTAPIPLIRSFIHIIGMLIGVLIVRAPEILPNRDHTQQNVGYGFFITEVLCSLTFSILLCSVIYVATYGRTLRRKFIAHLTHQEAYAFYQAQTDPTSRIYAHLVCDLVQAKDIVPAAIPALRDAVRLFGEAVHGLSTKKFATGDAAALRRRAATARERAFGETDPVLKAALVQEADAHEDAAVAATRNGLMTKRVTGLQDALVAQMEALRLELPTFQAHNTDMTHLLTLSEKVRAVTAQAGAITSAHAELDGLPNTTSTYAARTPVLQSVSSKHSGGS